MFSMRMAMASAPRIASCVGKRSYNVGIASSVSSTHRLTFEGACRRFSSENDGEGISDNEGDAAAAAAIGAEEKMEPKVVLPEGYEQHKAPFCAAWDLTCSSWKNVDRDSSLLSNWHNPDDPEDFSRIGIDKGSYTDYARMNLARMHDSVKQEMYDKYSADPAAWSVPKLATSYAVSQPRVQAILLLKEWEKKERELGLLTPEDEEFEAKVKAAHARSVRLVEDQTGAKINKDKYGGASKPTVWGPMGEFFTLGDAEQPPPKPDPDAHTKRQEAAYAARKQQIAEQEAVHKRVPTKRWTYVIKDTTAKAVR